MRLRRMPTVDTDAQLAAAGDMEAFEKIYPRYHKRVYSLCLRMTRNVPQNEDLAQDVFVQVFRKIKTFRGESSFATWLHRRPLNQVLMQFRKPAEKREETTEDGHLPVQISAARRTRKRLNPGSGLVERSNQPVTARLSHSVHPARCRSL